MGLGVPSISKRIYPLTAVNQIFLEYACLGGVGVGEKGGASEARDIHSFNMQVFDLDLS